MHKIFKPNEKEKTIITIMLSICFGMIVGVLSTLDELKTRELERKLLILEIEELSEMNTHLIEMVELPPLPRKEMEN